MNGDILMKMNMINHWQIHVTLMTLSRSLGQRSRSQERRVISSLSGAVPVDDMTYLGYPSVGHYRIVRSCDNCLCTRQLLYLIQR